MDDHQNGNLTKLKKEKKKRSNNNIKSLLTISICFSKYMISNYLDWFRSF
jgi:hypothetical protein